MEKGMCIGGMVVAGLMLLLFLLDLILGIPFAGTQPAGQSSPYTIPDIIGIISAGVLGYLSFNAYRDVR